MKPVQNILCIVFLIACITSVDAQWKKKKTNKDTKMFRYDIECEGVGKKGTKLVKVWTYSKKPKDAKSSAMRNAIHGILFKGYGSGTDGCNSLSPIIDGSKDLSKYEFFFDEFFKEDGEYRRYVTSATDGNIAAGDVLKVSRREYKVGVIVVISYSQLRKRMEKEGIIKKLSSGF